MCFIAFSSAVAILLVGANAACQNDEAWLNSQSWNTYFTDCAGVVAANQCSSDWAAQACPVACNVGCALPASGTCGDDDQWVADQGWGGGSIVDCASVVAGSLCDTSSVGYARCPVRCQRGCCSPDAISSFSACQAECKDDDSTVAALSWAVDIGITTCFGLAARGYCAAGGGGCPVSCAVGCCTPGSIAAANVEVCARKTCQDNQAALSNYRNIVAGLSGAPATCDKVAQNAHYCSTTDIFNHSCPVSCGVGCCAPSSVKGDGTLPFTIPFDTSSYSHSMQQLSDDANSGAAIHWRYDANNVYFGLAANAHYVAFGLNVKGPGMTGADIIICKEESGQVMVKDYHATDFTWPTLDTQQDWTTVAGGVTGNVIWCEVMRPRAACNLDQDVDFVDLGMMLYYLVAWAPSCVDAGYYGYHGIGNRRTGVFDFDASIAPPVAENEFTFTITAPATTVSTAPGSYVCSYHKLPLPSDGASRVDIIRHSIDQGGPSFEAGLNHHVDVNRCKEPLTEYTDGQIVDCDTTMAKCLDMMMGLYRPLPANQGIPVGGTYPRFVVLRRHFYNPAAKAGLVDTSPGTQYNVVYSTVLRPQVVSSLSVSMADSGINIPIDTVKTVTNLCPAGCTQRLGAVKIAQVFFHMHFVAGASAALKVIRNGAELAPVAVADPWVVGQDLAQANFDLQPGDTLKLDCTFNNKNAFVVNGGSAIDDEMCWAGLTIIGPPTTVTSCHSNPVQGTVWCPSDTESSFVTYAIPSATPYVAPSYDQCAPLTGIVTTSSGPTSHNPAMTSSGNPNSVGSSITTSAMTSSGNLGNVGGLSTTSAMTSSGNPSSVGSSSTISALTSLGNPSNIGSSSTTSAMTSSGNPSSVASSTTSSTVGASHDVIVSTAQVTAKVSIPMDVPATVASGNDLLNNAEFTSSMESAIHESLSLASDVTVAIFGITFSTRRLLGGSPTTRQDASSSAERAEVESGTHTRKLLAKTVTLDYRIMFPAGVASSKVSDVQNAVSSGGLGSASFETTLQTKSTEKLAATSLAETFTVLGSPSAVGTGSLEASTTPGQKIDTTTGDMIDHAGYPRMSRFCAFLQVALVVVAFCQ